MKFPRHARMSAILATTALLSNLWLHATPTKYQTGLNALKQFSSKTSTHNVVGMTGFYGQDQPREWLILTRHEKGFTEYVIRNGQLLGKRTIKSGKIATLPTLRLSIETLNFDSDYAFRRAEEIAEESRVNYDSVHYQIRVRQLHQEPVWMINMLDPIGRSIGIHYISAASGKVLRSVWYKTQNQTLPDSVTSIIKPTDPRMLYGERIDPIPVSLVPVPVKANKLKRVQFGAFSHSSNALELSKQLNTRGFSTEVVNTGRLHIVVSRPCSKSAVSQWLNRARLIGHSDLLVVDA